MCDTHAINYLEQCLAEAFAVVCTVESREAKDDVPELPCAVFIGLDEVASCDEVGVRVGCLPSITGEANLAGDCVALFQPLRTRETTQGIAVYIPQNEP